MKYSDLRINEVSKLSNTLTLKKDFYYAKDVKNLLEDNFILISNSY